MKANREILDCFDRLVVLTVWKAIIETMTFLVVIVLLYYLISRI